VTEWIAIWFEDASQVPGRAAPGIPAQGLLLVWLNALLGTARALELQYADVEKALISGALVIVSRQASAQFQLALHSSCNPIGTSAWIRRYDDSDGNRRQWQNFSPLRCVA
jgi:hypothetical protein